MFKQDNYNPLYAGFGNKETDAIAYSAAGINVDYIFTITPDGSIYPIRGKEIFSYERLREMLGEYFPEFDDSVAEDKNFDDIEYWNRKSDMKSILSEIDLESFKNK